MKKFLFLAIMLITLTYCKKNVDCSTPPPEFILLVNKNSELYKEFINQEGKIDKASIFFYKQVGNEKKQYDIVFGTFKPKNNNDYLQIIISLWFENDVYTGKTETLYLQNASKTYKVEVNGSMQNGECGKYAVTNEIRVDGVKVEDHYLAK